MAFLAVPAVLAVAGACSSDDETATEDTADTTTTTADPTDTDDPSKFAFGQEVKIVDGGVQPVMLAADVASPVVIRNTTATPQELVFPNPGFDDANTTTTGAIPPGGTFELKPIGTVSIKYSLVSAPGVVGTIQFEDSLEGI